MSELSFVHSHCKAPGHEEAITGPSTWTQAQISVRLELWIRKRSMSLHCSGPHHLTQLLAPSPCLSQGNLCWVWTRQSRIKGSPCVHPRQVSGKTLQERFTTSYLTSSAGSALCPLHTKGLGVPQPGERPCSSLLCHLSWSSCHNAGRGRKL